MAIDLTMPALSPTMEKGTLARWHVAVGDKVKPGDVVAEIETDKATMEFEATDEGTVSEIVVQDGTDDVPVGATLARLTDGEVVTTAPKGNDISLSPSARRAAKATGVDPTSVAGTGKDGRVTKQDLVSAKDQAASAGSPEAMQEVQLPAVSPTMEKGTIARWLISVGDRVDAGQAIVEIETDKATMEIEAGVSGTLAEVLYPDGSEDIPVGTAIALVSATGVVPATTADEKATASPPASAGGEVGQSQPSANARRPEEAKPVPSVSHDRDTSLSPLISRIIAAKGIDAKSLAGSGPDGQITLADIAPEAVTKVGSTMAPAVVGVSAVAPAQATSKPVIGDIPHDSVKLSGMRKTIARRLTESKQQIPHIYLTVDVRLDALLKLRTELNEALAPRGVKLSVNDLIIKAQALALLAIPECNVQFTPDALIQFSRADISVAVSIPDGLITPVIVDAGTASLSRIATSMKDLAGRARDGKLQPSEYQGGTATLSNLGMFGIKQFEAVINPPQAMILAVGAGERRLVLNGEEAGNATIMSATGSFDHRAIDGADAARFMGAFRELVEEPVQLIA